MTTGLGPLYDGVGHFLLSPEDVVSVLAMGLFAGQRGPAAGRIVIFAVPAAWLAAGLMGFCIEAAPLFSQPQTAAAIAVTLLVPGLLIASNRFSSRSTVLLVTVLFSGLHGLLDGVSQRGADSLAASLTLAGIAASVFTLVVLSSAFVVSLRIPWTQIAVRVAGSWIAATGLLLLGWSIRRMG